MTDNAVEFVDPATLIVHPENPRRGDIDSIVMSIERNGWFGTVVAQRSTSRVLAGNHRLMAAQRLGLAEVPVFWVDVDDDTALRILIADNRTSDLATYDDAALVDLLTRLDTDENLDGTGYSANDLADLAAILTESPIDGPDTNYSRTIEAPVYHPTGDKPETTEMYDAGYTSTLLSEIDSTELPSDVREFLVAAAHRHTVFKFDRIAEFYAHADPATQRLMERSGLVIIDYDDAVANGFVQLDKRLAELYDAEHGDD